MAGKSQPDSIAGKAADDGFHRIGIQRRRWRGRGAGRELDPLSEWDDDMGWIYYNARRCEEAIQEYRAVLALRPDGANALWSMGIVLLAMHQPQQSIPVLEKAVFVSNLTVARALLARWWQHTPSWATR